MTRRQFNFAHTDVLCFIRNFSLTLTIYKLSSECRIYTQKKRPKFPRIKVNIYPHQRKNIKFWYKSYNCYCEILYWLLVLPIMVMMMTTTIMDESLNFSVIPQCSWGGGAKADYYLWQLCILPILFVSSKNT